MRMFLLSRSNRVCISIIKRCQPIFHACSVRKLLLTHLGEEMLRRRGELPVATAEDGMVLEI